MVVLAGVVGRRIGIRPKRRDDWQVTPNLWGAIIGRPGLMKTPAIAEPLKLLKRFEQEAKQEFDLEAREYETAQVVEKATREVLQSELKKAIRADKDLGDIKSRLAASATSEPTRRRYLLNDPSVEKLGEILCNNPNGVTVFRDELTGLLRSLDRDGNETARAFYLESWNGNERHTVDRIGRGTIDIPACCVSVIGGIQPGPLADYLRAAVRGGRGDDGLVQRFQLMVWPDIDRHWRNVDRFPDSVAKQTVKSMFERLRDLEPVELDAEIDVTEPIPFLRFAEDAQELFDEWRAELEHRLRSGVEHPAIESHLSKYRSLIPTLALLIHLADERDGGPVTISALQKALKWGTYLESHARRIYGACLTSSLHSAKELAKKIGDGQLKSGFSLRDVYRPCWSGLADRDDAKSAVDVLVDHDWLAESLANSRSVYLINPRIFER
jgi:putative DNA primase/helicase